MKYDHYDSGRDARTHAPAFLDVFMATERMSSRVLATEDKRKGGVPVLGRSVSQMRIADALAENA